MADLVEAVAALYRWPASAAFGKAVPKTMFYQHGNIRAALREKFVDDVQRVTWAYKLADATIRLKGTASVPEIQVFTVETKGDDVGEDVLAAIDKTVQFPIFFEVLGNDRVRMVAAQKTLGGSSPKLGPYFTTLWMPAETARQPLPPALSLAGLYEAILTSLLPIRARSGESVEATTDRMKQARKLQRAIAALEKRLRSEPQLNRKMELRRQLRESTRALDILTDPAP